MYHVIFFSKGNNVKYISHLSLMRSFERALRRTDIPVLYSQGFNPRIKMSFALPMPVGMQGRAEIMYLETEDNCLSQDILSKLNATLPEGVFIHEVRNSYKKAEFNPFIREADYDVVFDKEVDESIVSSVFSADEVLIEKKSKRKMKKIDVKPLVKNVVVSKNTISLRLPVGEILNIRPDLVLKQLLKEYTIVNVTRKNIYLEDNSNVWNI